MITRKTSLLLFFAAAILWPAGRLPAVPFDPAVLPLLERPFLYGRDYYLLNTGRCKMLVQADKADLGPALLYLLFDAESYRQSKDENRALNFAGGQGMVNSALEVVLGGYPFTALGHETETRWTTVENIPAVEAVWWAGGLRVSERIFALWGENAFVRRIELRSVNLAGPEKVTLRLSLPPGDCEAYEGGLIRRTGQLTTVLRTVGEQPSRPIPAQSVYEIGPVELAPSQAASVDVLLFASVGPPQAAPALLHQAGLAAAMKTTAARWAATSTIATDDALVGELFDSARLGLPGMISADGIADYGMLEYGSQVVRDAANTMLGLLHAGQFELAHAVAEHILKDMVRDQGAAMIDNKFDEPDREELDQMGELMHALKAYRDWTGDDSLVRQYRARLLALIERPLDPKFRDATGMVHNRREFWERTLDDGYELAYQTYMVQGLRDAAELAEPLGVPERAARWRAEADRILQAVLADPKCALVAEGRLTKRRTLDGRRVVYIPPRGVADDVPGKTERVHLAEPDATLALPLAYGLVDPRSPLARKTLDHLETLRDARWFGGGYGRYHPSAEWDQPGAWPFATSFIMRAQHEAGQLDRSRRSLEFLHSIPGGRSGAWPEEIPVVRSTVPGILPWNAAEVSLFVVRHWLGVRFEGQRLVLKPALYPHSGAVKADLRFRKGRLKLEISAPGPIEFAELDGQRLEPDRDSAVRLPADFQGGRVVLHTQLKERER